MKRTRPAWIDVDLDAIVHNVKEISSLVNRDSGRLVDAMPIVKGNAYGHGIYEVTKALYENGFSHFGVATYTEALLARQAAPNAEILILGYTPDYLAEELVCREICSTVYAYEQAAALSKAAGKQSMTAKIHIKLDTGMHRLGFPCEEKSAKIIRAITLLPSVSVEGIFTHFATSAMREKDYVHLQYKNFQGFIALLRQNNVEIPVKHISNTGIILDNPEMHQDMVRFGSMVYGTFSSMEIHTERVALRDAFTLRAEVAYVKELEAGEGIGYDLAWVAEKPSKIATLPLGYADIGIRKLRNCGYVLLHGQRAPIVGCICMDQLMVDVSGIDVKIGDTATLIGKDGGERITIQEVAERLKTDGYEVVISANQRLPRRYWKNQELYSDLDVNLVLADYYARQYPRNPVAAAADDR